MALLLAVCACSDEQATEETVPPRVDAGCTVDELTIEGRCEHAGVPPDGCGEGFEADSRGGCNVILPADACAEGTMAIPGESSCREVAPCPEGRWGTVPVDGATRFVDAAYRGDDADGSADRPFQSVQEAVDAAAPGAVVAIAEGSYFGNVLIDHPVRLWGKCPALVELHSAPTGSLPTIGVLSGGSGAELHMLSVGTSSLAIGVLDASVSLDRVRVHDSESLGIQAESDAGEASVTIRGSLVERATRFGVAGFGATVVMEESVVRATRVDPSEATGRGVAANPSSNGERPSRLEIRRSLIDDNVEAGVYVSGSTAEIDSTFVTRTSSSGTISGLGPALFIQTLPDSSTFARATVRRSIFERNTGQGSVAVSASLTLESTVVRDALSNPDDQTQGRGVVAYTGPGGVASEFFARQSVFERNREVGVLVVGGTATLEACIVRDTEPQASNDDFGRGVSAQFDPVSAQGPLVTLRDSVVMNNFDAGMVVAGATATMENTRIAHTQARRFDGNFGDGLVVVPVGSSSRVELRAMRISNNARAGIANFSGQVEIADSTFDCNAFDLDGELLTTEFAYIDLGGNRCGCPAGATECTVLTAELAPPAPLP